MAKRIPVPKDWAETLPPLLKSARTATELRHVLCIWMRLALDMKAPQIATALGWSVRTVRQVQERFLKEGKAAFEKPGKGGRRNELMTREAEYALLRRLREKNFPNAVLEFRVVHEAVEKAVGREVSPSTVHRLLRRHGWHRAAQVFIPRDTDPYLDGRRRPRTGEWSLLRPETPEPPPESSASTAP
ncbi:MAG TPA: helix-turn-helix domain-containing protein [Terriglobia bacterium]|nr:helix-turn-helix domain-containing protein [Terriglobia bacterium]